MSPVRSPSVVFAWLYETWGGAEIQFLQCARQAAPGQAIVVMAPRSTDRTLRDEWASVADDWIELESNLESRRVAENGHLAVADRDVTPSARAMFERYLAVPAARHRR
jgi:hypothetical protein